MEYLILNFILHIKIEISRYYSFYPIWLRVLWKQLLSILEHALQLCIFELAWLYLESSNDPGLICFTPKAVKIDLEMKIGAEDI